MALVGRAFARDFLEHAARRSRNTSEALIAAVEERLAADEPAENGSVEVVAHAVWASHRLNEMVADGLVGEEDGLRRQNLLIEAASNAFLADAYLRLALR